MRALTLARWGLRILLADELGPWHPGCSGHHDRSPEKSQPVNENDHPKEAGFVEAIPGPDHAPAILDRWRPWLALAAALILIAYGPSLAHLIATTPLTSPGFRVW